MLRTFKKAASLVLVLSLILSVFPQFIFANDESSSKEFLSFSVEGNPGVIDNGNHTINVVVPFRSAVNNMFETFTVSEGASVLNHTSGVTRTDYISPVTLTVVAEDGSRQDYVVTVTIGPSSLKSILSFNLSNPAVTGFIDDEAFAIFLTVPQGTNVTALKPTFVTDESAAKVKVNDVVQVSGDSAQNFTHPLIYTVVALDGSTRNYTVTVIPQIELSTAKEITYFALASLSSIGIIDETNHKIALTVPFGTELKSLVPAFTSTGTRVYVNGAQQISGEGVLNFTSPVVYDVYDEAGGYQAYTVTVQAAAASASSTKELLTFAVAGTVGTVNEATHTISVVLPVGSSLLNQIATFTTNGQSVKIGNVVQNSGQTLNDFTSPLSYAVIAENGLTQNYVVTVVLDNPSAKVTSVNVPANGIYTVGQALNFGVTFDQAVSVGTMNGTPNLSLVIGTKTVMAGYLSGSGTSTLTFSYTVQGSDSDLDGIALGSSLSLYGGTIINSNGNTVASLTLNNIGSTAEVRVSTIAAEVSTIYPVMNITSTSADIGGDVISEGDSAVTERGIVYSKSSNPTTADTKVGVTGTIGSYTTNLTGLAAGTTYHARVFATNSAGTSYGNDVRFTTTSQSSVATVLTTDPVTNVTSISADVGGDVTSEGGTAVTVRGIVYSTSSNPTIPEDTQIVVAGTTGSYTSNLSGLAAGTTYHVRAFATNSVGTSYGNDVSFTTVPATPPIATVIAMSLNKHTGTMQVGDIVTVVATATMSDTTTQDVTSLITWTADDPSKVSINNGVITALQSGTVKVEAKYSGTSVMVDHLNLIISNPSIPVTVGTQISGTQGTQVITVEEPPTNTSPTFTTVVNIAKIISEITKKLEDSKGVSVDFNDMASHWADKTVKLFAMLGVVKGYEDGSFRPNDSITRGEFATIIFRVFGLTGSTSTDLSDGKGHWAEEAIIALSSSGIISGYEDGTFKPDKQITRAEIISIISKLVVLKTTSSQGTFKDIDGVWNKDQIQAAASMGLVNGQSSDSFAPQSNATRAEALTMILHALELDSSLKSLFEE